VDFDYLVAAVAVWILISATDDIAIAFVYFARRRSIETSADAAGRSPAIAIWVPLWKEAGVAAKMIAHNLSAIRYTNYHIFAGTYPNDPDTAREVRAGAQDAVNVHVCVCPHSGPTSKADCLNWIHQHMAGVEGREGIRFEVVLIHDAEDLIHPDSLGRVAGLCREFGMVQTPVLALPTPWWEFVHGIYCDDFAYMHTVDLPVRARLGGFVPSAGVGTAIRRDALDLLAATGHPFDPACLTEDYETGIRLRELGVKQTFAPVLGGAATREYFPRTFRTAWRQRSRWVTGIVFQGWERHGWGGGQWYWFWRDRKGLLGNPVSLLANLLFVCGCATGISPLLLASTGGLAVAQTILKIWASARIYGLAFGLLAPLRSMLANVLNTAASASAVWRYARCRILGTPLSWVKTEHAYPAHVAIAGHRRLIGEILAAEGLVDSAAVMEAVRTCPPGTRLGEYLVRTGVAGWDAVYRALGIQHSLPFAPLDPRAVPGRRLRLLPAWLMREKHWIPVELTSGAVEIATSEIPAESDISRYLGHFARPPRFRLVTPLDLERLEKLM